MRQIRSDLCETRTDAPFPGLSTHAYLWTRPKQNVLFYSPATDVDFDTIEQLDGIDDQSFPQAWRISGAGPNCRSIRFATARTRRRSGPNRPIHPHRRAAERPARGKQRSWSNSHARPYARQHMLSGDRCRRGDVSICRWHHYVGDDDRWTTYLVSDSDAAALASSLKLLGKLRPDVVITSASGRETGVHTLGAATLVGLHRRSTDERAWWKLNPRIGIRLAPAAAIG